MKLILKEQQEQQKQERKKFLDASAYKECIIEYKDKNGDIQKMLLVRDDLFESVIVLWRSSVYIYCISNDLSLEEIYEQIEEDSDSDALISIHSVSTTVNYELEKK